MPLQGGAHLDLLREAIATEGTAQRALLAGESVSARGALRKASRLYRESWEAAPPGSYGRLIGMLKAAVLAGGAQDDAAAYAEAVDEIVADFESRDEHLTGVPIADTALMLERFAESRGLARRPSSTVLPPAS